MEHEQTPQDQLSQFLYVLVRFPLFATGILSAFTLKQRKAIVERDDHQCQSPIPHNCNQEKGLEVDHILPQRYLYTLGVDPDFPENALTKCKNSHDKKHPDRIKARREYHHGKSNGVDTFKELQVERNGKLKERTIYWNDQDDRKDQVIALRRTQRAKQEGWIFPEKHERENHK